jgi:hypothetical protein
VKSRLLSFVWNVVLAWRRRDWLIVVKSKWSRGRDVAVILGLNLLEGEWKGKGLFEKFGLIEGWA